MRNLLIVALCIITALCFAACGNESVTDSTGETSTEAIEETSTEPVEETTEAVEPITEEDFKITGDGDYKEDVLETLESGESLCRFCYYDPQYDDSKEGVIKTHRGIVLGDSKEDVEKKYGKGKSGDFDVDNDYCYDCSKNVTMDEDTGDNDVSAAMRTQCFSYERYSFKDYTISFYFDENDEVSWIFFTRKE